VARWLNYCADDFLQQSAAHQMNSYNTETYPEDNDAALHQFPFVFGFCY